MHEENSWPCLEMNWAATVVLFIGRSRVSASFTSQNILCREPVKAITATQKSAMHGLRKLFVFGIVSCAVSLTRSWLSRQLFSALPYNEATGGL